MLDERDLQAIKALFNEEMDKKLNPINNRLERIEDRLEAVENSLEEARGATNYMVEWIDRIEKKVDATA